ncbi:MAG: PIN domain-containing protein [Candidatus Fervidibacter sacchari]
MTRRGCDTSFFRQLMLGHPQAVDAWLEAVHGGCLLIVSTLVLHELLVLYYREGKPEIGRRFVSRLQKSTWMHIVPVSISIAEKSAGYRHGLGLSTVDSVILATVVEENCDELLTTDRHFVAADSQGIVKVTLLA